MDPEEIKRKLDLMRKQLVLKQKQLERNKRRKRALDNLRGESLKSSCGPTEIDNQSGKDLQDKGLAVRFPPPPPQVLLAPYSDFDKTVKEFVRKFYRSKDSGLNPVDSSLRSETNSNRTEKNVPSASGLSYKSEVAPTSPILNSTSRHRIKQSATNNDNQKMRVISGSCNKLVPRAIADFADPVGVNTIGDDEKEKSSSSRESLNYPSSSSAKPRVNRLSLSHGHSRLSLSGKQVKLAREQRSDEEGSKGNSAATGGKEILPNCTTLKAEGWSPEGVAHSKLCGDIVDQNAPVPQINRTKTEKKFPSAKNKDGDTNATPTLNIPKLQSGGNGVSLALFGNKSALRASNATSKRSGNTTVITQINEAITNCSDVTVDVARASNVKRICIAKTAVNSQRTEAGKERANITAATALAKRTTTKHADVTVITRTKETAIGHEDDTVGTARSSEAITQSGSRLAQDDSQILTPSPILSSKHVSNYKSSKVDSPRYNKLSLSTNLSREKTVTASEGSVSLARPTPVGGSENPTMSRGTAGSPILKYRQKHRLKTLEPSTPTTESRVDVGPTSNSVAMSPFRSEDKTITKQITNREISGGERLSSAISVLATEREGKENISVDRFSAHNELISCAFDSKTEGDLRSVGDKMDSDCNTLVVPSLHQGLPVVTSKPSVCSDAGRLSPVLTSKPSVCSKEELAPVVTSKPGVCSDAGRLSPVLMSKPSVCSKEELAPVVTSKPGVCSDAGQLSPVLKSKPSICSKEELAPVVTSKPGVCSDAGRLSPVLTSKPNICSKEELAPVVTSKPSVCSDAGRLSPVLTSKPSVCSKQELAPVVTSKPGVCSDADQLSQNLTIERRVCLDAHELSPQPVVCPNIDVDQVVSEKQSGPRLQPKDGAVLQVSFDRGLLTVVQNNLISYWRQNNGNSSWTIAGSTCRRPCEGGTMVGRDILHTASRGQAYIVCCELWKFSWDNTTARLVAVIYALDEKGNTIGCHSVELNPLDRRRRAECMFVVTEGNAVVVCETDTTERFTLSSSLDRVTARQTFQQTSARVDLLRRVEGCASVVAMWSDQRVLLWNVESGRQIRSLQLSSPSDGSVGRLLWCADEKGFLFSLHQVNDADIKLSVTNLMTSCGKELQTLHSPSELKTIRHASCESGCVIATFSNGYISWNLRTSATSATETRRAELFLAGGRVVVVGDYCVALIDPIATR